MSYHIHLFDLDKFTPYFMSFFSKFKIDGCQKVFYLCEKYQDLNEKLEFDYLHLDLNCRDDLNLFLFKYDNAQSTIFFHSLNYQKQILIDNFKNDPKLVWLPWGFDLYYKWPPFNKDIFDSETRKVIYSRKTRIKEYVMVNFITERLFFLLYDIFIKNKIPQKIITIIYPLQLIQKFIFNTYNVNYFSVVNKFHYIIPVLNSEKTAFKKLKLKPIYFHYGSGTIDIYLKSSEIRNVFSNNILIGNSADPSNNHISAFKTLRKLNVGNRKIIVPLSYSGNSGYTEHVISIGKKYFGNNFQPILGFLNLTDYQNIISTCSVVILNHRRQQAGGNIITMCYYGAKIFLNERNKFFEEFNDLGIKVENLQNLNQINLDKPYSDFEVKNNKRLILKNYSEGVVLSKIETLENKIFAQSYVK